MPKKNAWKLRPDAVVVEGRCGHRARDRSATPITTNTIDPANGILYLHQSGTRLVHRYDVAKDEMDHAA